MFLNDFDSMLEQMLAMDFAETPNLKASVAIRDELVNEYEYEVEFANDIVAAMTIDVNGLTLEQAENIGRKWAAIIDKLANTLYDVGFGPKHVIKMADQFNLKYS